MKAKYLIISFFALFIFAISLVKGQVRVVCVGNSITDGVGASSKETAYPGQLASFLGDSYTVKNCGASGCTILRMGDSPYWNNERYTEAIDFDPDIVIIALGTNDSKSQNWNYSIQFDDDYEAMINSFREDGKDPDIYVCFPPPAFIDNYGIQNAVIQDEIIPIIQSIATKLDLPIIDFYHPLLSAGSYFPDGIHPNDQGARLMAQIVYKSLAVAPEITSGEIYKIVSKSTGKVLDVENSSVSNDANVDIWTDTNSDAQKWLVSSAGGNQYTLTNIGSGKLLHMSSSVPATSVNVNQYENTNDPSVLWNIEAVEANTFVLKCAVDKNFTLAVGGTGSDDGTNVQLAESSGSDGEQWTFYVAAKSDPAPTLAIADKIFATWKAAYYDKRTGNEVIPHEGFWGVAEMMEIVVDAYEVTGNSKYVSMFNEMYNLFLAKETSDWMWNEYNDDITWMVLACVRAGILTGNQTYIDKGKQQFDKMYARAIHDNGSWLTWKQGTEGTNSCINGPAMVACCYLAQATGNTSYYDKAIKLYNWSNDRLLVPGSGQVYDSYNVDEDKVSNYWSSTYNQGTFLGASVMLYNYTNDPFYLKVADRIANFTQWDMYHNDVINNEEGNDLNGFKGIFMRYARRYVADCNRSNFIPWLQLNAKVAYNNRNSDNIISTIWSQRAEESKYYYAFNASTAISLLVNCPYESSARKDAYSTIEAEGFDYLKGVIVEPCIDGTSNLGGVKEGFYTGYNNVDFGTTGAESAEFRLSSISAGKTIEIRLGSPKGELIGTATTPENSDWNTYTTIICPVQNVKGVQNVYLVFKGSDYICNLNYFKFTEAEESTENMHGLIGEYYYGMDFDSLLLVRIDPKIDFKWENMYPAAEVPSDNFSIRWTGKIEPRYTGEYTFYINSDNGRRVWVNNELIIDKWINDWGITYSGTISLSAGQKYDIKIEYFEDNGGADIMLEWESNEQEREVVPSSRLYIQEQGTITAVVDNRIKAFEKVCIYPNPATSFISIECGDATVEKTIIANVNGQIVYTNNTSFTRQSTIDISGLISGIYFVSLITHDNKHIVRKFVK